MKKIIVGALVASMLIANPAFADRDHHGHRGGGVNPWPFIAGAVVGGIIINEVGREREYRPPMRYVTVCEDIMLYDSTGRYIKTERHCREELAPAY